MTKKEVIEKWANYPDDAEVRLVVLDAEDYVPVLTGYLPESNVILMWDAERIAHYEKHNPRK